MSTLDFVTEELEKLKEAGLLINICTIEWPQGAWIKVAGKKVFNLCSNNYLGFASDPQAEFQWSLWKRIFSIDRLYPKGKV